MVADDLQVGVRARIDAEMQVWVFDIASESDSRLSDGRVLLEGCLGGVGEGMAAQSGFPGMSPRSVARVISDRRIIRRRRAE
jgi:hypothetical protein